MSKRRMKPCPECGTDLPTIDSSSAMRQSSIECWGCDYRLIGECNEETLISRWNKLPRPPVEEPRP